MGLLLPGGARSATDARAARLFAAALVVLLAWAAPGRAETPAPPAAAAPPETAASDQSARLNALALARRAVVGVEAVAVEDARSIRTLGRQRSGSGVVIGGEGLVLTIGYLVLEAESVDLVIDGERSLPARVVSYDVATGFGLLQALAPLRIAPVAVGTAARLDPQEPLMIASGGADGAVSVVRLVGQRPFSGYWEYHLDNALYTAPARRDHSGAGLFNAQGELVGIGSLLLADARPAGSLPGEAERQPGNLFVPAELLPPILGELTSSGRSRASQRAWIGVNCVEQDGQLRVVRVNDDSPAEVAGRQPGAQKVGKVGSAVTDLAARW